MPRLRPPPPGSIGRRLVMLVLAALTASFVVTALVSTWMDLNRQAALETGRLTQTARVIASLSVEAVSENDRGRAFQAVRSIAQMPGVSYARVDDAQGELIAETGTGARLVTDARASGGGEPSLWSLLNTGSLEASAPILVQGRTLGAVTVFGETPELRGRVLSTIWATLAGALAALVAGLAVAARMSRRISAPIVALAGLIRGVDRSGDYSTAVDIKAEGEVADLVAGFDTLLHGIRERDARIAAHVETLESQVAERTAELVVARDAAEQANAAKSDFLAVMSHEIRTPLNGILALSDLLAASDLPPRQQRHADVIAKSGRSLLGVINDILDFSKVEAGKMELESIPMDLAEIAEDVAGLFSEKALAKGLDLAVFIDPRLPRVLGDPTRLRQVIGNLANNAIKFTETGGVLIAAYRDPRAAGRIMLAVRDTGPGIPEDRLATLFEAFTQVDQTTTRKHGGTGLGLAICDRLVKAMEGEWRLNSALGRGSSFAFSVPLRAAETTPAPLPFRPDWTVAVQVDGQTGKALDLYLQALGVSRAKEKDQGDARFVEGAAGVDPTTSVVVRDSEHSADAARAAAPETCVLARPLRRDDILALLRQMHAGERPRLSEDRPRQASGTAFPGLRVLVVDDSEVNREVACEALGRLDVETFTAADGQDAVERLAVEAFDLVLMDGSMPVLDGFEATRRIRADEARLGRPRAVIVALTAHVVGAGAQAWRDCGMDDVVHKPFTLDDLRRVLGRFHPERAAAPRPTVLDAGATTADKPTVSVDPALFDPVVRGELLAMAEAGRADFVERVHALYLENAPLRLAEAEAAAADGDGPGLARAAHALKSMSLSLGARAVAQEALAAETAARETTPPSLQPLRSAVEATLTALAGAPAASGPSMADQVGSALRTGALHVVYQPLFERNGGFSGKVEALVRWTEADGRRRFPDDFIPQLEAEGAVARLTDFVLERAMTETRDRPDLRVSVNASASEFQEAGFARRIAELARRCAFPASRLEIEVTETAMLDISRARVSIEALRSAGFGVALDDFGAGYTSLHALRELKFTTLKIDRSFVERCSVDTASAAIIHAVVGVGRALGMKVVCEGVETAEQAEFLRIAGAHYLQGYHFQKPSRLEDLPLPAQAA